MSRSMTQTERTFCAVVNLAVAVMALWGYFGEAMRRIRLFMAIVWRRQEVGRMDIRTAWAVACAMYPKESRHA